MPYSGPLDLVGGAVVAYGHRALSASWLGNDIYTIHRDLDDAEMAFACDATTGDAPAGDITTFIDTGNGYGVLWNDQSGNGRDLAGPFQTKDLPQWSASVLNSLPGWVASNPANAALNYASYDADFDNAGVTVFMVASQGGDIFLNNGSAAYVELYAGDTSSIGPYVDMNDTSNDADIVYDPMDVPGIVLIDAAWQYGAEDFKVNGASITLVTDYSYGGGPIGNIDGCRSTAYLYNPDLSGTTSLLEIIVYPSILSGGDRDAVRANIAAYYGITL